MLVSNLVKFLINYSDLMRLLFIQYQISISYLPACSIQLDLYVLECIFVPMENETCQLIEIFKTKVLVANPIKLLAYIRGTISVRFSLKRSLY